MVEFYAGCNKVVVSSYCGGLVILMAK